jgi:hypothetical protein
MVGLRMEHRLSDGRSGKRSTQGVQVWQRGRQKELMRSVVQWEQSVYWQSEVNWDCYGAGGVLLKKDATNPVRCLGLEVEADTSP